MSSISTRKNDEARLLYSYWQDPNRRIFLQNRNDKKWTLYDNSVRRKS